MTFSTELGNADVWFPLYDVFQIPGVYAMVHIYLIKVSLLNIKVCLNSCLEVGRGNNTSNFAWVLRYSLFCINI